MSERWHKACSKEAIITNWKTGRKRKERQRKCNQSLGCSNACKRAWKLALILRPSANCWGGLVLSPTASPALSVSLFFLAPYLSVNGATWCTLFFIRARKCRHDFRYPRRLLLYAFVGFQSPPETFQNFGKLLILVLDCLAHEWQTQSSRKRLINWSSMIECSDESKVDPVLVLLSVSHPPAWAWAGRTSSVQLKGSSSCSLSSQGDRRKLLIDVASNDRLPPDPLVPWPRVSK